MIDKTTAKIAASPRMQRYYLSASLECFLRSKYLGQVSAPVSLVAPGMPTTGGRTGSGLLGPVCGSSTLARLVAIALTLMSGAFAFEDRADASPILGEAGYFIGETAAQYTFDVSSAGTLSLNLIDYQWPSPLADLTLQIASPTQILGGVTGPGQTTLTLNGPGTYYAYVVGNATSPLGVGVYGLVANFQAMGQTTPVPLPASVSLLLGGIAATLWSMRRKARVGNDLGLVGASS